MIGAVADLKMDNAVSHRYYGAGYGFYEDDDMKVLMTPEEASLMAFGGKVAAARITEADIAATQRRYIEPVLGASLWGAIESGKYAPLVEEWIKPALALFLKYMLLPAVSVRVGELGVVRFEGESFAPASADDVARMRRAVREAAGAALDAAVDYVEASAGAFPEYDPRENVRKRISLAGGVVM